MAEVFLVSIAHVAEKPFGKGRTARERGARIVEGWRGEVISDNVGDRAIYTGACSSRGACIAEIISALKLYGLSGTLRIV